MIEHKARGCKCGNPNHDSETPLEYRDKSGQIDHKSSVRSPVLFTGANNDPSTLSEVIGVGSGAVSACWENLSGAGEFDSSRAATIVDEMIDWIQTHYVPRSEVARLKGEPTKWNT